MLIANQGTKVERLSVLFTMGRSVSADVLEEAYRACRRNDGAPGCDGLTFDQITAHGQDRWLEELREEWLACKQFGRRR